MTDWFKSDTKVYLSNRLLLLWNQKDSTNSGFVDSNMQAITENNNYRFQKKRYMLNRYTFWADSYYSIPLEEYPPQPEYNESLFMWKTKKFVMGYVADFENEYHPVSFFISYSKIDYC